MSRHAWIALAIALGGVGCWTGGTAPSVAPPDPPPSHPAPRDAAPRRRHVTRLAGGCDVSLGPPVAATGLGTIRVELPAGEVLTRLVIASRGQGAATTSMQIGTALAGTATVPPGTYSIDLATAEGRTVRCEGVEVAAGGETTVRVTP